MTLAQYIRVLRSQWYVVVLIGALTVAAAAAYTFHTTRMYAASTKMFVSVSSSGSDLSQLNQGGTFTQQRVKSYADVVTSQGVLNKVIQQLKLPMTTSELAKEITAQSSLDTVVMTVTVTDASPRRSADIANQIAQQFPAYVTELETPTDQTTSPVKVTVTDSATVPTSPVSPRVPLNLALGILIGLGLGIGAAVLRDQLNTAIKGIPDVEELTGAIPLGVVPFDSNAPKQPLAGSDEHSGRAEAFRVLRTNLQFADIDNPPRIIVVTSALPNEGKSTTACNLAQTLALAGARVVLVDGDLRKPNVGGYLGISNSVGLSSVLSGRRELREVLVPYGREGLSVLPSGPTPPNPSELLGTQHMADLLATLANHYDVVIIDAPPLLPVTDAAVLATNADGAVLVVRHGKTRRESVQRAIQSIEAVNGKLLGTVMNFAPKRMEKDSYYGYYGYGKYGNKPSGPPAPPAPVTPNASWANGHARGDETAPTAVGDYPGSGRRPR